eukprot:3340956-Prymnesium_polylepis.1
MKGNVRGSGCDSCSLCGLVQPELSRRVAILRIALPALPEGGGVGRGPRGPLYYTVFFAISGAGYGRI